MADKPVISAQEFSILSGATAEWPSGWGLCFQIAEIRIAAKLMFTADLPAEWQKKRTVSVPEINMQLPQNCQSET
jgi:hypothetical protein